MANTWGRALTLTLWGESHGAAVGAVLDGLPAGIPLDEEAIAEAMAQRQGIAALSTPRREADHVTWLSGCYQGRTTGTPLCLCIENRAVQSAAYDTVRDIPRPGHADYVAQVRYGDAADLRGGGHFSGRLTAPLVAAGAVVRQVLGQRGIHLATHILRCAGIADRPFDPLHPEADITALGDGRPFPVLDEAQGRQMQQAIAAAHAARDSVGGVLECAVSGMPAGVGEPFFDTAEGVLAQALFAIPAVKGVTFGDRAPLSEMRGSAANDAFAWQDGRVVTRTNHAGGILGGMTNGMPLLFQVVVKPTPSIALPQVSVDLSQHTGAVCCTEGRHDPAIVHRAAPVVTAVAALALGDLLTQRYGNGYFAP